VFVEGHARNDTCELGSATLHDAIAICRVGRAKHTKWNPTMPENRPCQLPAVQRVTELPTPHLDGQLIDILRIEVVPDVVVARAIIAGQVSGERRNEPARRKWKDMGSPQPALHGQKHSKEYLV